MEGGGGERGTIGGVGVGGSRYLGGNGNTGLGTERICEAGNLAEREEGKKWGHNWNGIGEGKFILG